MSSRWIAVALANALAACIVPSSATVQAHNCSNSVSSFEQSYCDNVIPMPARLQEVQWQRDQVANQCRDPASQQRLASLSASCIEGYRQSATKREAKDDALRARYATQVKALTADPRYLPALEDYRAARDEAVIAEREYADHGQPIRSAYERKVSRTTTALRAAEDRLRELIASHDIDPKYSEVLGVW